MSSILAYGANCAAGNNVSEFWDALRGARVGHRTSPQTLGWSQRPDASVHDLLLDKLSAAYDETRGRREIPNTWLKPDSRLGVIFASTKGDLEDFAWNFKSPRWQQDPMSGLLRDFLARTGLQPVRSVCVSNACSSALSAVKLAQAWLHQQAVDDVLILAADAAGSFVVKGFESLQLLSPEPPRPFDARRAGFWLGEAAACLWISRTPGDILVHPVGLDAEGSAVTRPSESGRSLVRAARQIPALKTKKPDLVIAHGTGTRVNDATEDLAYQELFGTEGPRITGTKWCVGHTLAACGALDLIAAAETLRRQQAFALATTSEIDPQLRSNFWRADLVSLTDAYDRVLVASLGFGGLHAIALIEKGPTP